MRMNIQTEEGFARACEWTRAHLSRLNDGGIWLIPRSGCTVRVVSHQDKTATIRGAALEPGVEAIMHTLGWKITKEKP